jgi:hypothetical protein
VGPGCRRPPVSWAARACEGNRRWAEMEWNRPMKPLYSFFYIFCFLFSFLFLFFNYEFVLKSEIDFNHTNMVKFVYL